MKILLRPIIVIFLSLFYCCDNSDNANEKNDLSPIKDIVVQSNNLGYDLTIHSFEMHNDSLKIKLHINEPPIEDFNHIGFLLSYSIRNNNKANFIGFSVDVNNKKLNTIDTFFYNFSSKHINIIKKDFSDVGYKKLISKALETFNEYDTPIIDLYINRIHDEFSDLKQDLKTFEIISEFHKECLRLPKGEYGKAGRTLLLIYSLDRDLDMLNNGSVISEKIKLVWDASILNINIDTSLNQLLN